MKQRQRVNLLELAAREVEESNSKAVYGLMANMQLASKIAQSAKSCRLTAQNSDTAEAVLQHVRMKRPALIIFDLDSREAEAFKVLSEIGRDASFKTIPTIGCISASKRETLEDVRRAGCHRVYMRTEFLKSLNEILARYAS